MGLFQSPNNSTIMGTATRESLGVVSGLLAITRTVGQTTGTALLGAIWASVAMIFAAGSGAPGASSGGPDSVPIDAQVRALGVTFYLTAALIAGALCLAIWWHWRTRGGGQSSTET
jgi:hypothetical protein